MDWKKCWKWFKSPDGQYHKVKVAVSKNVDSSWQELETCSLTGGYLESNEKVSKKEKPAKKEKQENKEE